jgi:hypothetical protein
MAGIVIQLFDETAAYIRPSLSTSSLNSIEEDEEGTKSAPFTSSPLDEFRGGFETALKYRAKVRDASKKNAEKTSSPTSTPSPK